MNAAEFAKEMTKYGYQALDESGVVMLTADMPFEKMQKDIRDKVKKLGYDKSWGVRGYSKNSKARVSNIDLGKSHDDMTDVTEDQDNAVSSVEEFESHEADETVNSAEVFVTEETDDRDNDNGSGDTGDMTSGMGEFEQMSLF